MIQRTEGILILAATAAFAFLNAQNQPPAQEWELSRDGASLPEDQVRFTILRSTGGSSWKSTSPAPLKDFAGLNPASLGRFREAVNFEYRREAGALSCEGTFSFGVGRGTFRFQPDPAFITQLEKLGYSPVSSEDAWRMMMSGVTLEMARTVREAGLPASLHELIELKEHGVSAELIAAAVKTGRSFTASELTRLSAHGVNAAFLSGLESAGYRLDAEEIIGLRNHGVDLAYARGIRDAGLDTTSEGLQQLRQHGVPVELVKRAKELSFVFTGDDFVTLTQHGVNAAYLERVKESGIRRLTAHEIVELRQHGVD